MTIPSALRIGKLFCFGLGYSARRLASHLMAAGWSVAGTTRSAEKAAELAAAGIDAVLFDRSRRLQDGRAVLEGTTHLLVSIGPDEHGDIVIDHHLGDLQDLAPPLRWVGYLSTTGVYGNRDGGTVDEESDLRPSFARTRRRVTAEQMWLDSGLPAHVFRLAGIYGPGRSVLDSLRSGKARRIHRPGQVFSRIHVDDIATTLLASMVQATPGAIYNACDDLPASQADVVSYGAGLLGLEPPPLISFEDADLSTMARSFYSDNRRVNNRKIREALGVDLLYPDYFSGLDAIFQEENSG